MEPRLLEVNAASFSEQLRDDVPQEWARARAEALLNQRRWSRVLVVLGIVATATCVSMVFVREVSHHNAGQAALRHSTSRAALVKRKEDPAFQFAPRPSGGWLQPAGGSRQGSREPLTPQHSPVHTKRPEVATAPRLMPLPFFSGRAPRANPEPQQANPDPYGDLAKVNSGSSSGRRSYLGWLYPTSWFRSSTADEKTDPQSQTQEALKSTLLKVNRQFWETLIAGDLRNRKSDAKFMGSDKYAAILEAKQMLAPLWHSLIHLENQDLELARVQAEAREKAFELDDVRDEANGGMQLGEISGDGEDAGTIDLKDIAARAKEFEKSQSKAKAARDRIPELQKELEKIEEHAIGAEGVLGAAVREAETQMLEATVAIKTKYISSNPPTGGFPSLMGPEEQVDTARAAVDKVALVQERLLKAIETLHALETDLKDKKETEVDKTAEEKEGAEQKLKLAKTRVFEAQGKMKMAVASAQAELTRANSMAFRQPMFQVLEAFKGAKEQ